MRTDFKSASMNSFNSAAVKPTAIRAAVIAPTLDPAIRLILLHIPASSNTYKKRGAFILQELTFIDLDDLET